MHVLCHITKGIYQFVANIVRYIPTKYHLTRSQFDLVIVKIKGCHFLFETQCVTCGSGGDVCALVRSDGGGEIIC